MDTPRGEGRRWLVRVRGTRERVFDIMHRSPDHLFQEHIIAFVNCPKDQPGPSRREPKTRASSDADISLLPSDADRPTNAVCRTLLTQFGVLERTSPGN